MKKLIQEFLQFISKGNVVDLAVAVMLGTAFQKMVSSLVNHILMPLVGWLFKTDLSQWFLTLQEGVANLEAEAGLINPPGGWAIVPIRLQFGLFIQTMIDFLLIGVLLFAVVKVVVWSQRIRRDIQAKITLDQSKKTKR